MSLQRSILRNTVQGVLHVSAWLARSESRAAVSRRVMGALALATIRIKGIRQAKSLNDLGRQWQRGFPSAKQVPVTSVTDTTVYAEIHTPCPLRGTGNVDACHRMMEFDRRVVARAGGQFVVLQSQAEPGHTFCRVAMRWADADVRELVRPRLP